MIMETPCMSHIKPTDYDDVYEPAEDSMLLIDALEKDMEAIKMKNPTFCLEVGSGSGIVISAFAMEFPSCYCLCTDINMRACVLSNSALDHNYCIGECINMNLAEGFIDKQFDVIIFNPPYVVTQSEECNDHGISASWAGGVKGREVTDKLLKMIPNKLAENGWFYLLLIKDNIPEEVVDIMAANEFKSELLIERRVRNEQQYVYKFFRQH